MRDRERKYRPFKYRKYVLISHRHTHIHNKLNIKSIVHGVPKEGFLFLIFFFYQFMALVCFSFDFVNPKRS